MSELTHIGPDGRAVMVDISEKPLTDRLATARGEVFMAEATLDLAIGRQSRKGDPIAVAELAGIMGAKRTADIIPLCHPLPLTGLTVSIAPSGTRSSLVVTATARTINQTGVEMEALMAVSAACLTLYDMLKSADKSMVISNIELIRKTGGKSGDFVKETP